MEEYIFYYLNFRNNKSKIVEEGLAFFLVKSNEKVDEVYFKDNLPDKYKKHSDLGGPIIKLRNVLIILTFVEILAAIWGFSYYFIRRSIIYVVVNLGALLVSVGGVISSIYLNEIGLILYTLLTTALPGTFFFYQIFELFTIKDSSQQVTGRLNDHLLLLIFSLPYLYDFACGIVSIVLMSRIANFNGVLLKMKNEDQETSNRLIRDEIDKLKEKYSYDHLKKEFERRESSLKNGEKLECLVCLSNTRTMLNKPCNHMMMCEDCSKALTSKAGYSSPICPQCRASIEKFEKIYIS